MQDAFITVLELVPDEKRMTKLSGLPDDSEDERQTDRGLQVVVGALLDRLALLAPRAARLRVAGERNLDDDVLALVEEGRVAEPRGNVDLGRR